MKVLPFTKRMRILMRAAAAGCTKSTYAWSFSRHCSTCSLQGMQEAYICCGTDVVDTGLLCKACVRTMGKRRNVGQELQA